MSQRVVRRRRLTELLLILLRTGALALLAFAFARPFFWQSRGEVGSENLSGLDAAVILLDQSYLMRAPGRMEKARQEAIKALDALPPGSAVAVAAFDERLRALCPFDGTPAQARQAIRDLEPGWGAADLEAAIEQVQQTLLGQRKEQGRRIHLISGFPQSAIKSDSSFHLPPGTALRCVDVAGPDVANVAITRVEVPRMAVASAAGKDAAQKELAAKDLIGVQVLNASDQEVKDAEVALSIAGKPVEKRSLTIKPHASAAVTFSHTFSAAGDILGQVSISGTDALPADNTAYFCVAVAPRLRVLLLDGDQQAKLVRDGGFFLETALAPEAAGSFEVRRVAPPAMKAEDLKDADAILLSNVSELSPEQVKGIQDYVAGGRGCAFFCGEGLNPDKFNASFAALAPCKLWKPALSAGDDPVSLTWVDYTHEVFRPFSGPRAGDFALARFQQYWLVKDSQQAKALARFANRNPALLETGGAASATPGAPSRGRVLLFASSADLGWNDLPVKAVFPPLIHQIVKRLCTEQAVGARTLLVGQPASVRVPAGQAAAELLKPDGSKVPLELREEGGVRAGVFTPAQPGIYQVESASGKAAYAANLDARAVNPAHMDLPVWEARIRPLAEAGMPWAAGVSEIVSGALVRERVEQQQMLWMYLISLAVLVLAMEMALSAWAGKAA
jgi:hypothetical protein